MQKTDISYIKDDKQAELYRHIFDKGLGNSIRLDGVPTATAPLLQSDELGSYNGVLYLRIDDTILVITPSSTISITRDET